MIKAAYGIKHLIGVLLTASEGESKAIMTGSVTTGRQAWCWSSSREPTSDPQAGSRESEIHPDMGY